MGQYFDNVEGLAHEDIVVHCVVGGQTYSLKSDRGVFSKDSLDDGTRFLLETILQADLGDRLLDVGCGIGPIGLILAKADPKRHVDLSDVNLRALVCAQENAKLLGVASQIEIITSDVYTSISHLYDTIVSNPPIRAGKKVTYRIYDEALSHLVDGGKLIIVIRRQQGADSVYAHLLSLFNKVEILGRHKGYVVIAATKEHTHNV
ncbi:MAG: methyltransferase [Bacilli bacterium]